eukprot:jgi/Picre1/31817/NNA_007166.t1
MVDTAQHTVAVLPDQYLYNQDTVSKIMSSSWYRLDDDTYLYRLKAITPPQMIFSNACNQQEFSDALAAYMAGAYEKARDICACLKATYPSFRENLLLLGACEYRMNQLDASLNTHMHMLNNNNEHVPAEAYATIGNILFRRGRVDEAISYYLKSLELKYDLFDAVENLTVAYVHKGWMSEAALELNPQTGHLQCALGTLWYVFGASGVYQSIYWLRSALAVDKACWLAYVGLGDIEKEHRRNYANALAMYTMAENIMKRDSGIYASMGVCYRELGQYDQALVHLQKALALDVNPEVLASLGSVLLLQKYYQESIVVYSKVLSLDSGNIEAHNNMGNAYKEMGKAHEAITSYSHCLAHLLRQSSELYTNNHHALQKFITQLSTVYNNLGGILKLEGRLAESISCYEQVVMLQPHTLSARINLASAYKDFSHHDEAIIQYKYALSLQPNHPDAISNMFHSLQSVCDWTDRHGMFSALQSQIAWEIDHDILPTVQPFQALSYPVSSEIALKISQRYAEHCIQSAEKLCSSKDEFFEFTRALKALHPTSLGAEEELRVAYISSDFGNHPLSHLMGSVFGMHRESGRGQVRSFCYSLSPDDGSPYFARVKREADVFRDISHLSPIKAARMIAEDAVHIAVNLNGYTKGAKNEIFAYRPAPLQISLQGFPATMGATFIDYIVLDKVVCPESSRKCYSENVVYMPHSYFANDYKHAHMGTTASNLSITRASIGLPEDDTVVIYSCSNQLYKYDPDTFAAWCRILKAVPHSILWLLRFPPAGEARIRAAASQFNIDQSRIVFTDVADKPIHIARSGLADVFLDTPLCNAHTTGCDVLWGGCPMVTLPLERMASRVGASLCQATGLGHHMIASDLDTYESMAIRFGLDRPYREEVRNKLRASRLSCPLFDTSTYVKDLERAYLHMWEIHEQGQQPHDFEVASTDNPAEIIKHHE